MKWPQWFKHYVARRPRLSRFLHALTRGLWIQYRVHRLGVPIVAITGTNGKTTIAVLLERIFSEAGYRVGLSCTDGVRRDGQWIARRDLSGMGGVWLSARDGNVDVLVAETARGGMIHFGFAFRACDVAVVTMVSNDHLGIDGVDTVDELADVKSRLVQRVSAEGTAVLNADDRRVARMRKQAPGAVIWFAREFPPAGAEQCIFARGGMIYRRRDGVDTPLLKVDDVAITENGLLPYQLNNALALLGVVSALRERLPVTDEVVADVLRSAGTSKDERRFAFRLLDYRGRHVLLSHSKNPPGFAMTS